AANGDYKKVWDSIQAFRNDEYLWWQVAPVRCFVSHEALTDKAQGSGQAESLDVFHEYRSEIENFASAKYDAGKIRSDGLVVVDSPDFNPENFKRGLAGSWVGVARVARQAVPRRVGRPFRAVSPAVSPRRGLKRPAPPCGFSDGPGLGTTAGGR